MTHRCSGTKAEDLLRESPETALPGLGDTLDVDLEHRSPVVAATSSEL
jgi:hypothetical protein